jgi:uncharacterized protein (TIGR02271 family)
MQEENMARDPRDESLGERLRGTPDDVARAVRGDDEPLRGDDDTRIVDRERTTRDLDDDRERTVQLREEELRARKERVEAGEVGIRKEVVEEEKTLEVPVTREEVFVERHAVERRPSDRPIGEGETIEVPVYEEEVEVEKRPVVYEEVAVGKRAVEETERVSDTVRREVADLDARGDVEVRGWDEARAAYRQGFESRAENAGRRWEDVEPGYRYSHEMANDPRYKGREWEEVEPELRSGYRTWSQERGYRTGEVDDDDAWAGLRADVRETWEEQRRRGQR